MRFVTYEHEGQWTPGVSVDAQIVDATRAALEAGIRASGEPHWRSNRAVLELTGEQRGALLQAAERLADGTASRTLEEVRLGPPITDPEKIICLGLNYRDHAQETGLEAPPAPLLFAKYRNSLIGNNAPIELPLVSEAVDYEGELAVVIGRRCKGIAARDGLAHVAGAMAFNDVSARDLQFRTSQWLAGKALDGFAPCGPELVLMDEIDDIQHLDISTRLNGEVVQSANTSQMIFSVADTVSYISGLMTLEVGDIIATGTPAGVGFTRDPPLLLSDGDLVEIDIERIGVLSNPVQGATGGPPSARS
jgi:2-keto-4-pentenoate hydratase/2-oxohepta-3-ene-1,7-dioic acid hydratase in catechol pathway